MKHKEPSKITLDFIEEIQTKNKRIANFLWENFIINKSVFPIDSANSYSSIITAKNIYENCWNVLDVWTWIWVQAIIAAKKWAKKVLAIDIDDNALENTKENIFHHKLEQIIETRKSNLFENIKLGESFDLIIAQLPFADNNYNSSISHLLFDYNFKLHDNFLKNAKFFLNKNWKILIPSGDISNEEKLKKLINKYEYKIENKIEEVYNKIRRNLYKLIANQ